MLKATGNDIRVAIGKGTPKSSDVIYGAIFLDETNRRVITKNKAGYLMTIANYTVLPSSPSVKKITSNYTAPNNSIILVDARSKSIAVYLPKTPTLGTTVKIIDLYRTASNHKIVINRNGKTIHKQSVNDTIECDGGHVTYQYLDSTWLVIA